MKWGEDINVMVEKKGIDSEDCILVDGTKYIYGETTLWKTVMFSFFFSFFV